MGLSKESAGIFDINKTAGYGWPMVAAGSAMLVTGIMGIFAIFSEMFVTMCIYSALCFLSSLMVTPIVIARVAQYNEFRSDFTRYLRTAWLAVAFTHPNMTMDFERNNQCCGWYNVFDYCTTKHMSGIMYNTIQEGSVTGFIKKIDQPDFHGDIDDYVEVANELGANLGKMKSFKRIDSQNI